MFFGRGDPTVAHHQVNTLTIAHGFTERGVTKSLISAYCRCPCSWKCPKLPEFWISLWKVALLSYLETKNGLYPRNIWVIFFCFFVPPSTVAWISLFPLFFMPLNYFLILLSHYSPCGKQTEGCLRCATERIFPDLPLSNSPFPPSGALRWKQDPNLSWMVTAPRNCGWNSGGRWGSIDGAWLPAPSPSLSLALLKTSTLTVWVCL